MIYETASRGSVCGLWPGSPASVASVAQELLLEKEDGVSLIWDTHNNILEYSHYFLFCLTVNYSNRKS